MQQLSAAELRAARRDITMIFQQFNLLMQRTCLRNIMFPMELSKTPKDKAEARARELLELVGLPDKADAYPAQLSGGQKTAHRHRPRPWPPTPRCCCATKPPARWTPTPPTPSCS